MEAVNTLAEALKLLRAKTGMTQEALGRVLHVTKGQVSRYENSRDGITHPHEKELRKLLKKHKIKIDNNLRHREALTRGVLREFYDLNLAQKITILKTMQQMNAHNLTGRLDSNIYQANEEEKSEKLKPG